MQPVILPAEGPADPPILYGALPDGRGKSQQRDSLLIPCGSVPEGLPDLRQKISPAMMHLRQGPTRGFFVRLDQADLEVGQAQNVSADDVARHAVVPSQRPNVQNSLEGFIRLGISSEN